MPTGGGTAAIVLLQESSPAAVWSRAGEAGLVGRERWWCLDETVGSGSGGRELDSECGLEVQSSGLTDGHG